MIDKSPEPLARRAVHPARHSAQSSTRSSRSRRRYATTHAAILPSGSPRPGRPSEGVSDRLSDLFSIGALALALALTVAPQAVDAQEASSDEEEEPSVERALSELDLSHFGSPVTEELADPGSLLLETEHEGLYLPAPQLDTEVHLRVTGVVVRAEVVQRFHNPTDWWVEGLYLFPLPETAAVDQLEMRIGSRVVLGEIQEREEAARIYSEARQAGQRASLVRQDRPNVFRTAVANIGPGETVEIAIEFQQLARFDGEHFRLRFPTVVAPRFHGKTSPHLLAAGVEESPITPISSDGASPFSGSGIRFASLNLTEPGDFAGGYTTSDLNDPLPADSWSASLQSLSLASTSHQPARPEPNFLLTVDLEPGFPIENLSSSYHSIETIEIAAGRYGIGLVETTVIADRDFELVWTPARGRRPQTTLLAEEFDGELYALLLMMPPSAEMGGDLRLPREAVFVVDTSGSMAGDSIEQARAALRHALGELRPEDSFNIIRFDSETRSLYPQSVPVSSWTLAEAEAFIENLEANGGTQMLPALQRALDSPSSLYPVRQVIFITDGSISNEASLLSEIRHRLGESRLFTVGIGSAPNAHFMRKAAEFGRGTFTFIGNTHEVEMKMSSLFAKLAHPIVSDLEILWPDPTTEAWPKRVPDLYLDEPLVVAARMSDIEALSETRSIELRGRRGGMVWSETVSLPPATAETGIEKLWARRRIASMMDRYSTGQQPEAMRQAVLETALDHHLVSRFTSLVAVDTTPTGAPEPGANATDPAEPPGRMEAPVRRRQPAADRDAGTLPVPLRTDRAGRRSHSPPPPLPPRRRFVTLRRLAAVALIAIGLAALGEAVWIRGKAILAQHLLERSWDEARAGLETPRPWPWADTWPVARLVAPAHDVDVVILSGASLRNLAFAPAHFDGTPLPGKTGNAVIAGHRDTHFDFLARLQPGDELIVERANREKHLFVVTGARIVAPDDRSVLYATPEENLTLITCYPFDDLVQADQRYVVRATHQGLVG